MHGSGERYINGQIKVVQTGDTLTHYYKNGEIKARGMSIEGMMQGEWQFFRQDGQLMQIGNLQDNQKHGLWVRYDVEGNEEYRETFAYGKQLPKAK